MKFMMLIYGDPATNPADDSPESAALHAQWMTYSADMWAAGIVESGAALHPTPTATTVRVRGDETLLTDGPFAETKETLGGYYVLDVPDLDVALAWAAKAPNAVNGSVEIRPVVDMDYPSA